MRQFIEFVPIALFVAVYFTTRDIYLATAILMAGVCIQVGFEYYQDKTLSKTNDDGVLRGDSRRPLPPSFSRMRFLLNGSPQSLTGYSALPLLAAIYCPEITC